MILNTPTAWRPTARLILAVLLLALPLKPPSAAGDIRAAVASVTKLSGTMPASGGVIGGPRISPDGLYAIYRADPETDETYDLWSVPLDGSLAPVRLNGPIPTGRFVREDFAFSPDGQYVLFAAEQDVAGRFDLYRVPVGGGATLRLSDPTVITGDAGPFRFTPSGDTVLFTGAGVSGYNGLYAVPTAGGAVTPLTGPGMMFIVLSGLVATKVVFDGALSHAVGVHLSLARYKWLIGNSGAAFVELAEAGAEVVPAGMGWQVATALELRGRGEHWLGLRQQASLTCQAVLEALAFGRYSRAGKGTSSTALRCRARP